MFVRLTQIDGKLPNLALMKLSHWHKSKGDTVLFEQSINRRRDEPDYGAVYGSAIFTDSAKKIALFREQFPMAIIGGSGVDQITPREKQIKVESIIGCGEYEYEHYDYAIYPDFKHSIGFTQRGCRLRCPFCGVPNKEGKNQVVNTISNLWRPGTERKIHLLDNDFFGQAAWRERSLEILDGKFKVCFNQGINIRLIHKEGAEMLSKMKYMDDQFGTKRIYTAWDNGKDEKIFTRGVRTFLDAGIRPRHVMVYMLCGYWQGETWGDIFFRFDRIVEMGLLPYPMVYMPEDGSGIPKKELKKFQRYVVRGYYRFVKWEAFKTQTKKQYYASLLLTKTQNKSMLEIKFSGANPDELMAQIRTFASMGGVMVTPEPGGTKSAGGSSVKLPKGETKADTAKDLTEEDVRKAWSLKKADGHDVSELVAINAKYGAKNFSTLKPENYAAVIADIKALAK